MAFPSALWPIGLPWLTMGVLPQLKIEKVKTDVGANGAKIKQVQTQVDEIINIIHYININDTIIIIKGD